MIESGVMTLARRGGATGSVRRLERSLGEERVTSQIRSDRYSKAYGVP